MANGIINQKPSLLGNDDEQFPHDMYLLDDQGRTCVRLVDGLSIGMDPLYKLCVNPVEEEDRILQFYTVDGAFRMRAYAPYALSKQQSQMSSAKVRVGQKVVLPIGEVCFSTSFAPRTVTEEFIIEMRRRAKPVCAVDRRAAQNKNNARSATRSALPTKAKNAQRGPKKTLSESAAKHAEKTGILQSNVAAASPTKVIRMPTRSAVPDQLNKSNTFRNTSVPTTASSQVQANSVLQRTWAACSREKRDPKLAKALSALFGLVVAISAIGAVTQLQPASDLPVSAIGPIQQVTEIVPEKSVDQGQPLTETPEPQKPTPAPTLEDKPLKAKTEIPALVLQMVPPTLPRFVDRTLDEAQRLLREGKVVWPKGHNAVELTLSALGAEPENARALQLLKNARYILLTVAQDSYAEGYRHDAYDLVERILAFDPGEPDVMTLRQQWISDQPPELRYLTRTRK